jgi:hypothetical protein
VLFATHFKEIAIAFDGRPGFVNLHLHSEETQIFERLTRRLEESVQSQ